MGLFSDNGRGFDRVDLIEATGTVRRLSRAEFEALPLDQRVRAILRKQLRFFIGDKEVPMRDALGDR
jgi:hypothetical protein